MSPVAHSWALKPTERLKFYGYREALREFLAQKHKAGEGLPSAIEFIQYLRDNKSKRPDWSDWLVETTSKTFKYRSGKDQKTSGLSATSKAIRRLLATD